MGILDDLKDLADMLRPTPPTGGIISPPSIGGVFGGGRLGGVGSGEKRVIRKLNNLIPIDRFEGKLCPGAIVYCDLAVVAEHTGIYVGGGKIVHLNGNGRIEKVNEEEFRGRLDGANPSFTVCCATYAGKLLCDRAIAERAKSAVGGRRDYNVVLDNCHQFTWGCISGDFDSGCTLFCLLENKLCTHFNVPDIDWKPVSI
ncbi:MAG: lecithin retinol acyltransferase family protein [Victivallaceae bacterium]|nr:lecithin retinol acyltransferase family protein [Victivallaceae bacterium]